jgi:hypothetical protein
VVDLPSLIDLGKKYYEGVGCKSWEMYGLYEGPLANLREKPLKILEIGVFSGSSLLVWNEYFPNAEIVGIDITEVKREFGPRVRFIQGMQQDIGLLKKISEVTAPDGWDIIIDDASHIGYYAKTSFWYLFKNHLKHGGLYFIEDWQTGYWDDWKDGHHYSEPRDSSLFRSEPVRFPSHDYGMVGMIKQIVDEAGRDGIHNMSHQRSERQTMIHHMDINAGFVLIQKM